MPYRILDSSDNIIETTDEVKVSHGGALESYNSDGFLVNLYAPGNWGYVFWEELEE
ncbi:hypothetical protein SEA_CECE_56 [Microbacterium phage Cece]|nr:hypothetical protein SEA_CECE_56 [Microbacterium phage Cece]